jgi:membrane protein required for colicin V production
MILDVLFAFILIAALYHGFTKGVVNSLLSFVAIFLGILIAMNFSYIVAGWMSRLLHVPPSAMPIFSFVIVVIVVILCIKLVAWLMEKLLKKVSLNTFNKVGGAVLWGALAAIIFGVFIWLVDQMGIFSASLKAESFSFRYVVPLGPSTIDYVASLLPYFKMAFTELNNIIQSAAAK